MRACDRSSVRACVPVSVRAWIRKCLRARERAYVRINAHHGWGRQTQTLRGASQRGAWIRTCFCACVGAWMHARERESERTCVLVFMRVCVRASVRMSEFECMRASVRWCVDACVPALVRGCVRVSERGNMVRQTDIFEWTLSTTA